MCAWDIDSTIWYNVRDKILKDRYAGCCYSMITSSSPVIIRHRGDITMKERKQICKLFPDYVRLEFQHVEYKGEIVTVLHRGEIEPILVQDRDGTNEYYKAKGDAWIGNEIKPEVENKSKEKI